MKDKLSKGLGYPLKPSVLQAAMAAAKVQTEATLFQHNSAFWRDRPLFDASFSPPGQLVDNQEEVLWIGCRAVPGHVCNAARSALQEEIIPSFIEWITKLEALPHNSPIRREKQKFERDWQPPEDPSPDPTQCLSWVESGHCRFDSGGVLTRKALAKASDQEVGAAGVVEGSNFVTRSLAL